jgi:hypothetical protein
MGKPYGFMTGKKSMNKIKRVKFTVSAIIAAVGIISVLSPQFNDLINNLLNPWLNMPADDACIKYQLNRVSGEQMCTEIIGTIQKEVQQNGIHGLKNIPATLTCENINHAGDEKCIQYVKKVMALLPF